jgi:polar amino acid transport system substrate-binding protein
MSQVADLDLQSCRQSPGQALSRSFRQYEVHQLHQPPTYHLRDTRLAQGSAPDGFLTRTLKNAEIVRVPGGLAPAREALATGRADVYGENVHLASRILAELPGSIVLDGRFNLVQMSIAVPKHNAAALPIVNEFVRDAKRDGLIAQLISQASLRGVRPAP